MPFMPEEFKLYEAVFDCNVPDRIGSYPETYVFAIVGRNYEEAKQKAITEFTANSFAKYMFENNCVGSIKVSEWAKRVDKPALQVSSDAQSFDLETVVSQRDGNVTVSFNVKERKGS